MENNIKLYKALNEVISAINLTKINCTFDEEPIIDSAIKVGYAKAISDVLEEVMKVVRKY